MSTLHSLSTNTNAKPLWARSSSAFWTLCVRIWWVWPWNRMFPSSQTAWAQWISIESEETIDAFWIEVTLLVHLCGHGGWWGVELWSLSRTVSGEVLQQLGCMGCQLCQAFLYGVNRDSNFKFLGSWKEQEARLGAVFLDKVLAGRILCDGLSLGLSLRAAASCGNLLSLTSLEYIQGEM